MKKLFMEEQIFGVLKTRAAGAKLKELCRELVISDATLYKWKAKFCGMEVLDTMRLEALEAENAKLKKLLAEAELDKAMMKELLRKN